MSIVNKLALNCITVVMAQAFTMYNFQGAPRHAMTTLIAPLLLGLGIYLIGRAKAWNATALVLGVATSSLSFVAAAIALNVHPILGYPLFQFPLFLTALLTVKQQRSPE